eukprot:1154964-Pelagomonas_calceolata.AAC.8
MKTNKMGNISNEKSLKRQRFSLVIALLDLLKGAAKGNANRKVWYIYDAPQSEWCQKLDPQVQSSLTWLNTPPANKSTRTKNEVVV